MCGRPGAAGHESRPSLIYGGPEESSPPLSGGWTHTVLHWLAGLVLQSGAVCLRGVRGMVVRLDEFFGWGFADGLLVFWSWVV